MLPGLVFGQEKMEEPAHEKRQDVLNYPYFTVSFFKPYGLSSWAAYELTADETKGTLEIEEKVQQDPGYPDATARYKDYKKSDYLPGMLVPGKDLNFSEESLEYAYYITNIAAMKPGFANGKWSELEELTREWANKYGSIYIVTGPDLSEPPYATIGKSKITVPKHFYKVVMDSSMTKAVGFYMSNRNSSNALYSFAMSVDELEEKLGIDFFPLLDDAKEERIESSYAREDWTWDFE